MKEEAHEAPRYHSRDLVLERVVWVMSAMCTCWRIVGGKGAMPKSSHHRGLARCWEEGEKEWSDGAPAARSCRHTMSQSGVGRKKVSGGIHLDVGVLTLPHRVSAHGIEQLVNRGGLSGKVKIFREGGWLRSSLHKAVDQAFPPR